MKKVTKAALVLAVSSLGALSTAQQSSATTVNYVFKSTTCVASNPTEKCGSGHKNWATSKTYLGTDGSRATVTGWANTEPRAENTDLQLGEITHWDNSGVGVKNDDARYDDGEGDYPEHAIDNDERYDLALISLNQAVLLNELTIGWSKGDADISILAYIGSGDPSDPIDGDYLDGKEAYDSGETLTSHGWTLLGNYDVDSTPGARIGTSNDYRISFNPGGVVTSHLIVSAYNPIFGSECSPDGKCATGLKDRFKLYGVGGHVPPTTTTVPLPAAGWMLLAGIGGLVAARRRKKAA